MELKSERELSEVDEVLEYDPKWPKIFQQIRGELEQILKDMEYIRIEHIGITSVPGLPDKPIIDIDIIINSEHLEKIKAALTNTGGYSYMGNWGIPDRHPFRNPHPIYPTNLYVCIDGCQALRNHLAVRDTCREDAWVRFKYGQVKLELARREWRNVDAYCNAKTEILTWILRKAGMRDGDVDEIAHVNNQAAV